MLTSTQKFYLCLMVCKATPVEVLVDRITKRIRRESVIGERECHGCHGALVVANSFVSHKEGRRSRHRGYLAQLESEVPAVVHATPTSLPRHQLLAYPVFRCDFVPATSGAGTAVALSHLQQIFSLCESRSRRVGIHQGFC